MSSECYRIQDIDSPSLPSLHEMRGVRFVPASRLSGLVCRDMYGDRPYGLYVLEKASLRGECGYIFSAETPILEQNADFLRHKKFLRPRFEGISERSDDLLKVGELVSLTSRRHNCFWHWMMDSLPKVLLAEESGFRGDYLIPSRESAPWAAESLTIMGIPQNRILASAGRNVHAELLYVPTFFCGYNAHHNLVFARLFREWVRSSVHAHGASSKTRIFVGRRTTAQARRLLNQEELSAVAATLEFQTIFFEEIPLREQLALSSTAEAMIGGHGSGLTHSLFMNENSLVIELFPFSRRQTNDCYQHLSSIPGHNYHPIESSIDQESDIHVPPNLLRSLLAQEL
jgi:Glycosyltransferase 61